MYAKQIQEKKAFIVNLCHKFFQETSVYKEIYTVTNIMVEKKISKNTLRTLQSNVDETAAQ